jgi:hypothetical protein
MFTYRNLTAETANSLKGAAGFLALSRRLLNTPSFRALLQRLSSGRFYAGP